MTVGEPYEAIQANAAKAPKCLRTTLFARVRVLGNYMQKQGVRSGSGGHHRKSKN
jgi:hypothetical protein